MKTESETLACLIIDDALLKPKYRCLVYETLLEKMKKHNFFTEIAFIPYNYKRSHLSTVRLFLENPEYYAICIHGCDHVSNEFGGMNYQLLKELALIALLRMEEHKRITGLSYDPIMVFPQGLFSSLAMKALKDQGYFAAFNSTLRATDYKELPAMEYRYPATMIYHNFPLFLRRYPKDRAHFVDDIASGRPIIIVEHHCVFRNGYKKMTDLIDWINSLGNIKWTSLLKIAEHYLQKKYYANRVDSQMYRELNTSNAKVHIRRFMSEVRDNYIETNSWLSKVYKMLRR